MAKKTLLSENQIASFMKLANIRTDKIQNFKKVLKEGMDGMGGTGEGTGNTLGEDTPEEEMPDMEAGTDMEPVADMEPEAPQDTVETGADELMGMIKDAVKAALADAGLGSEAGGEEEMEMSDEMDMESDEEEMEDEGEEEEAEMEEYDELQEAEEEEEEEEELQEAKKMKAAKKARNLKGGDAKKMKESLAFDNVDLVTDDEIINEVLKRVIRRLV